MPSPHLERKLKETLGEDAGAEQAAVNDRIDPIRGDIAELRHEFEAFKAQIKLDLSEFRAAVKHELLVQTRWMFAMWAALLAAIAGLYAR